MLKHQEETTHDYKSLAALKPSCQFGLAKFNDFNFYFINNCTLAYPITSSIAFLNVCTGKTDYLLLDDSDDIQSLPPTFLTKDNLMLILRHPNERRSQLKFLLVDLISKTVLSRGDLPTKRFQNDSIENQIIDLDLNRKISKFTVLAKTNEIYYTISVCSFNDPSEIVEFNLPDKVLEAKKICFHSSERLLIFGNSFIFSYSWHPEWILTFKFSFQDELTAYAWLNESHLFIAHNSGSLSLFNTEEVKIVETCHLNQDLAQLSHLNDEPNPEEEQEDINRNNKLEKVSAPVRQLVSVKNGFVALLGAKSVVVYQENTLNEFALVHVAQINSPDERIGKKAGKNVKNLKN
jgi:hypothetical protein